MKVCHLVVKFATNASGAMWLPNLVTESISGSVVPLAMFKINLFILVQSAWTKIGYVYLLNTFLGYEQMFTIRNRELQFFLNHVVTI